MLPIEDGEVYVSVLKGRPNSNALYSSEVLQNWIRATNIRLRLMQERLDRFLLRKLKLLCEEIQVRAEKVGPKLRDFHIMTPLDFRDQSSRNLVPSLWPISVFRMFYRKWRENKKHLTKGNVT